MSLISFVRVIRQWLWLIVLAAFVAGGATYAVSNAQPPQYEASVTIQVNAGALAQNSAIGLLQIDESGAQTYAVLVKTYPILEATVNKLSLPLTPEDLSKVILARIIDNTSLLVISVTYPDPARATDIATELAQQLILASQPVVNPDQQQQIALLRDEINKTHIELQTARSQFDAIDKQLMNTPPIDQQATLTAQRQALMSQINAAQISLAQMVGTLAGLLQQSKPNILTVVEPARPPQNPVSGSTWINAGLAAIIAAILAAGVGLVIDIARQRARRQPVNLEPAPALPPENLPPLPAPPGSSAPKPTPGSKKHRVKT